ncbi:hypothetical protein Tco_0483354 [Tanacetum coccineum]
MERCIYTLIRPSMDGLTRAFHGLFLTWPIKVPKITKRANDCYLWSDQHFPRNFVFLTYVDLIDTSVRAIIKEEIAKFSSQPKSTYEAAASLSEFELTNILKDKMEEHKSYLRADYKRELYDALVKSDPKSKESKSTSSSKGTSRSQHKSSGRSAHIEEQSHIVDDSGVRQNQEFDTGNNDEQPDDEAAP